MLNLLFPKPSKNLSEDFSLKNIQAISQKDHRRKEKVKWKRKPLGRKY